jgi:hypothetical protein
VAGRVSEERLENADHALLGAAGGGLLAPLVDAFAIDRAGVAALGPLLDEPVELARLDRGNAPVPAELFH